MPPPIITMTRIRERIEGEGRRRISKEIAKRMAGGRRRERREGEKREGEEKRETGRREIEGEKRKKRWGEEE